MNKSAVYMILGYPVHHSQSPAMHNAAFRHLGLDDTYVACAVKPGDLRPAIDGLRALNIAGANVTLPYKTDVLSLVDELTAEAEAIGAVNTLAWNDGRLLGDNTDAAGLARSLREGGATLVGAQVTVVGAGGAARAAVVGLARAGAAGVTVVARRSDAARALLQDLQPALRASGCSLRDASLSDLGDLLRHTDLLVQATSATLGQGPEAEAFATAIPLDSLPVHAIVTDLVYKPLCTAVLKAAKRRGLRTVDGLGMLLHQGALAFERWTGRPAPLDVMRAALLQGIVA